MNARRLTRIVTARSQNANSSKKPRDVLAYHRRSEAYEIANVHYRFSKRLTLLELPIFVEFELSCTVRTRSPNSEAEPENRELFMLCREFVLTLNIGY